MDYKNIDFNSDVVACNVFKVARRYGVGVRCRIFEELSKKEENAFKAELSCYTVKSLIKRDIIVY
jgi:hypothetical protein